MSKNNSKWKHNHTCQALYFFLQPLSTKRFRVFSWSSKGARPNYGYACTTCFLLIVWTLSIVTHDNLTLYFIFYCCLGTDFKTPTRYYYYYYYVYKTLRLNGCAMFEGHWCFVCIEINFLMWRHSLPVIYYEIIARS